MKYLMKFNEAIEDKGYKEITYLFRSGDMQSRIDEDFYENEIEAIDEIIKPAKNLYTDDKSTYTAKVNGTIIYIYKKADEWFYVVYGNYNACYECDQFDGLLKLLKDNYKIMKYLKKFNESIEDKGYKEITYNDYLLPGEPKGPGFEKFSYKELAAVREIVSDIYSDERYKGLKAIVRDEKKLTQSSIEIFKTKDEWFYVMITRRYLNGLGKSIIGGQSSSVCYECDQLEGLIQLLKDKYIN